MKNENYNVIIKTLDDRAMYKEIGRRLQELDRRRYWSMWAVPLLSAGIVLLLWLKNPLIPILISALVSLFGAVVTYFIFQWARVNHRLIETFHKHAALLEKRKNKQESYPAEILDEGPYSFMHYHLDPSPVEKGKAYWSDMSPGASDMGKGQVASEKAIYMATIALWLLTLLFGIARFYVSGSLLTVPAFLQLPTF